MTKDRLNKTKGNLRITVMEPGWDGHVHLPGNLGLLRVVCGAYPDATVSYVGGEAQIGLMQSMATPDIASRVHYVAWPTHLDKDTLPIDVYRSLSRLRALPKLATHDADLIVMCSCTATMLSAINWAGLAERTCAMLHGNANELSGWRSRNPLRSSFDLTGALKRFCLKGGRVTVLEERIRDQMSRDHPWLASSLTVIPHPLLPEEACKPGIHKQLTLPIKVGFAGRASLAKGFPDFLKIAQQLQRLRPGVFEFFAFGMLAPECAQQDQTVLATPAHSSLSRQQYLDGLNSLHYIFVWHHDDYYGNAASGVVYDAINLGLPLIARHSVQISDWATAGLAIANSYNDVAAVTSALSEFDIEAEQHIYQQLCANIEALRESLSLHKLSQIFVTSISTGTNRNCNKAMRWRTKHKTNE